MIRALDQVRLQTPDLTSATHSLERLLARTVIVSEENAAVRLDNIALEIAWAEGGGEGFTGLALEVENADTAVRACERRALKPSPPVAFAETDPSGKLHEGRHVDLDTEATFGVPITLIERAKTQPIERARVTGEGAVTGLDHIVILTRHPNRAAALYGARLGLDMRLDRTEPKWGARLMFFRAGDLIVEVVHNLADEPKDAPDKLWGLSWRVADIEAAHARLKSSNVDISELRPGRKPGTRVFTVKNNTLGVPTLFVEPTSKKNL